MRAPMLLSAGTFPWVLWVSLPRACSHTPRLPRAPAHHAPRSRTLKRYCLYNVQGAKRTCTFLCFHCAVWGSDRIVIICMFKSQSFPFDREEGGAHGDEKGSRCIF